MLAPFTDVFYPSHLVSAALGPVPPFNFRLLLPFAVFPLLLIALLIVLPGVRDQRTLSLLTVAVQLTVGVLLIGSIVLPFWKVTVPGPQVLAHLQAFSRQRHVLRMGVAVGLHSLNISLEYIRPDESVKIDRQSNFIPVGLFLNEQFKLNKVSAMGDEMHRAFTDGVPFPVLKVLEYFSMGQEAFAWGRQFRNAGHFTGTALWAAFFTWLVQCLLLLFVPHHFAKAGLLCGSLALLADVLFLLLSPSDLLIPFPSADGLSPAVFLNFRFGACFWMSVSAALLSLLFAATLISLQSLRLYSLHTVLSASLDDTVGPPKCRFGAGRKHSDDIHNSDHCRDHRFARIPITPCQSGKTSLTSHCSLDNSSPAVSSRSTARFSTAGHQRTFVSAPFNGPPISNSSSSSSSSNKPSVSSSIFSISGTSFGSMARGEDHQQNVISGGGEVIRRSNNNMAISRTTATTVIGVDQQQQQQQRQQQFVDVATDEDDEIGDDVLISDDIKHFTTRTANGGGGEQQLLAPV